MTTPEFELSRRRFLNQWAAVAGLTAVAQAAPWATAAQEQDGEKVRIGCIGMGSRGMGLAENLLKSRNCVITAVCDNYPPNLEKAKALLEGRAQAFTDYRALLDSKLVDAVVIATPLDAHAGPTIDALDAGLPVFCEKAMARTLQDCVAMVQKARSTGQVLQIGHQRLFKPTYLNALKRVRDGEIGTVTQIRASWHRNTDWRRPVPPGSNLERKLNWRLYKAHSAGLMTELASHQIQVANWFFDDLPTRIMGSGSICYWKDGREVYDHAALIYDYPGGRKLVWTSLLNNRRYGCEEQIQGDKGTIEAEIAQMYSETPPPVPGLQQLIGDVSEGVFRSTPIGGATWRSETPVTNASGVSLGSGEYNETLLQLEAFAEAVKKRRELPNLLREGFHASVGCLLGETAMDTGQPVVWPSDMVMPKEVA